jgi:multiple sugar transport system permease protein
MTRAVVYTFLTVGAIVFSFPFVWMAATSLKTERELFRKQFSIVPEIPDPPAQSPYYDDRHFGEVDMNSPQALKLQPLIGEADRIVVKGAIARLSQRIPPSIWNGDEASLLEYARTQVTPQFLAEIAAEAYRELAIGSLHVRNKDLEQFELARAIAPSAKWKVLHPVVASLRDAGDARLPYAAVSYDFSQADRFTLQGDFDLPFDAEHINRLILRLRPDDSWHSFRFHAEWSGVRYVAERDEPLADTGWLTMWYQLPSADDYSTKIKKWRVLNQIARGPQFDHGPRALRVTIEFARSARPAAALAKAERNYWRVRDFMPLWRYVRVSLVLVVLNVTLTVLSSSLVAYAFARLQWPGRDVMFVVLLGTMMIPGQVTMIPHFLIWKWLGAYNTLTPLWAGAALGNAFFIFLMRQFLRGIPPDLEEAARIDGCGVLRTWWHVMLPLVKPSLAAIAIFTFMATWNDFLTPLIYIADQRLYPLAFGLYAFSVQVDGNPVLTMGAAVLMTLPVIAVFFAAQRYFIQGVTLTGMKG